MSDVVFRHAAAGEERAVIDFINQNFDMRLPLINRPEFYRHYYARAACRSLLWQSRTGGI